MIMSRRARRMERHHQRAKNEPALNLVSLMDIFTILVFFLLVSSGDVQQLQSTKAVKLPPSTADQKPKETVAILVNNENIFIEGRVVASVPDVMSNKNEVIAQLKQELENLAKLSVVTDTANAEQSRQVTIMGDREIPYSLLKKIMLTCTDANYNNISLAVMKKSSANGAQ